MSYPLRCPLSHFLNLVASRETSNKALNAINSISLIPFLMAFLTYRAKLPSRLVYAAGELYFFACHVLFHAPHSLTRVYALICSLLFQHNPSTSSQKITHQQFRAFAPSPSILLALSQSLPLGKVLMTMNEMLVSVFCRVVSLELECGVSLV